MKFLKALTLIATFTSSVAFASTTVECIVSTNNEQEKQTVVHTLTNSGHGGVSLFETQEFSGFVSSANGYLVTSITLKETNQTSSIYGTVGNNSVGGGFISGDNWLQIACQ